MAPARANVLWHSFCFIVVLASVLLTGFAAEDRAIYLVLMEGESVAFHGGSPSSRLNLNSEALKAHAMQLEDSHDQLLQNNLETGSYSKLYSFKHIANGFAVHITPSQAEKLKSSPGVKMVEKDRGAKLMTTYTPRFLELPEGVWTQEGGQCNAGEGIVIGFVDTGINPAHLSFAYNPPRPFTSNISNFSGACETGPLFPAISCNGKIVLAKFFSAGARAVATLNASVDILSPFDADGHGRLLSAMDPGKLGEILKHLETQNELLTQASESVIQELSKLRGEEEMMMRKYYAIMSEHGKVKKVQELHEFWQKNGHGKVSTDNGSGNSTALVTVPSQEES